jgi:hypothetical protein
VQGRGSPVEGAPVGLPVATGVDAVMQLHGQRLETLLLHEGGGHQEGNGAWRASSSSGGRGSSGTGRLVQIWAQRPEAASAHNRPNPPATDRLRWARGGWGGRPAAMAERGGNASETPGHKWCSYDRGRGLKAQTSAGASTQALNSGGHSNSSCVAWLDGGTRPQSNQVSISVRSSPTRCRHWILPEHVDATGIGSQKARRHRLWLSEPARNVYTYKFMDRIHGQSGPCAFS